VRTTFSQPWARVLDVKHLNCHEIGNPGAFFATTTGMA
jgi:hypothetical protein